MSHLLEMAALQLTMDAIRAVAKKLNLPIQENQYSVYGGVAVTGLSVKLPGWYKPVTYTETEKDGVKASYDNYHSRWGEISEMEMFHAQVMAEMDGYDPLAMKMTRQGLETVFELEI